MCCGYGPDGMGVSGFDCVNIPGALSVMTTTKQGPSAFCGQLGLVSMGDLATPTTVCCEYQTYHILQWLRGG